MAKVPPLQSTYPVPTSDRGVFLLGIDKFVTNSNKSTNKLAHNLINHTPYPFICPMVPRRACRFRPVPSVGGTHRAGGAGAVVGKSSDAQLSARASVERTVQQRHRQLAARLPGLRWSANDHPMDTEGRQPGEQRTGAEVSGKLCRSHIKHEIIVQGSYVVLV